MKAPKYESKTEEKANAKISELSESAKGALFLGNSAYRTNYVDLSLGGTNIERRPNFPVYQLPFKGTSSYQKTYNGNEKLVVQEEEYEKLLKKQLKDKMKKGYQTDEFLYP